MRQKYIEKTLSLLIAGGKLVGVLFDTVFETAGPPFDGAKTEYDNLFFPAFKKLHFDTCYNSIKPRAGRELFIVLQNGFL